jgi:hypothetical protein
MENFRLGGVGTPVLDAKRQPKPLPVSATPPGAGAQTSYRLADVAVHRVRQWAGGQGRSLAQETVFRESFGRGSQARQALEQALDDASPRLFDDVVDDFLKVSQESKSGKAAPSPPPESGETVARSLMERLPKEPVLQDLLSKLGTGMWEAAKSKKVTPSTYAYNAVAILGLEPAIQRRLRAGGLTADQRKQLQEMKELLVNLRMGGGTHAQALKDWFNDLKNPASADLSAHVASRLNAAGEKARQDIQGALADTQQTLKGASIFLGHPWAAARASLSDALRLGAGDAIRNFVNHAAAEAVQQGKKGADLAVFMAEKLGATSIESLVPKDSPIAGLLAQVQKMVVQQHPTGDAQNFAIPNLLLACGIAQAAHSSTSLTTGKHRDALKVMAAVAQSMAEGRPGALTRWLGPAKSQAVHRAVDQAARVFRGQPSKRAMQLEGLKDDLARTEELTRALLRNKMPKRDPAGGRTFESAGSGKESPSSDDTPTTFHTSPRRPDGRKADEKPDDEA